MVVEDMIKKVIRHGDFALVLSSHEQAVLHFLLCSKPSLYLHVSRDARDVNSHHPFACGRSLKLEACCSTWTPSTELDRGGLSILPIPVQDPSRSNI